MTHDELKAIFNQQAATYDTQWAKMAPIRNCLHFLVDSVFAGLPANARILCVGVGTGAELAHLAQRFPGWQFTAVEPSPKMLEVCRQRAEDGQFAARCTFIEGYIEAVPQDTLHDAATCFVVSQFIVDRTARSAFFRAIADRLHPGGILASSDLASDLTSDAGQALLYTWMAMMNSGEVPPEALARMQAVWEKNDVAILPVPEVAAIVQSGGFHPPVQFFQAGLIHAFFARRAPG